MVESGSKYSNIIDIDDDVEFDEQDIMED